MDSRRPTSADVAALAGVSRTTVSFVLNGRDVGISAATRQRVLDAARELGYHPSAPARQLAGGRSHTIGLVLRQSPEQVAGDAFLAELIRGLTGAARSAGFRVIVETLGHDGERLSELVGSRRVDGLVLSGPRFGEPELDALVRSHVPVVVQGSLPGVEIQSVDVDNRAGAQRAVEHLLGLGHSRIACITNAPLTYTSARERLDGWEAALRSAGIEPDPLWTEEADFDAPSGTRAMTRLLERMDPDAVFAASDVVALGAITALRAARRRVPEDVSVVGFDDIPLAAYLDPPLTTVRLPAYEIGHTVGRALLDRIATPAVATRTLLPTELIVRASTARARGSIVQSGAG
jgi:LacI family transcriptional regulator